MTNNNYRSFFGLKKEPFGADINRNEILKTTELIDVKDRFDYVIRLGAIGLITGEVGSGKTTVKNMVHAVLSQRGDTNVDGVWIAGDLRPMTQQVAVAMGTGNIAALMIPYQYLDKVFLSHLHTDHMGDVDVLWAGGWTAGRPNALRVWGPSGETPVGPMAKSELEWLQLGRLQRLEEAVRRGLVAGLELDALLEGQQRNKNLVPDFIVIDVEERIHGAIAGDT